MRFLVFAGSDYYPDGGWEDFIGAYPSQTEAVSVAQAQHERRKQHDRWWHVVDLDTRTIVASDVKP